MITDIYTKVNVEFTNEERETLDSAYVLLDSLINLMEEHKLTEGYFHFYDDAGRITKEKIVDACETLNNLINLYELL